MKNYIMIAGTMMIVGFLLAEPERNVYRPQAISVGTASKMIIPAQNPKYTVMWEITNAVAYGEYVRVPTNNSNTLYYWCVVAGSTSNTPPTWISTNDVSDGTVTWRYINPDRNSFTIQHGSTNKLFLGWSVAAESGKGQALLGPYTGTASSGLNGSPVWRGEVYALFDSGTNNVLTQEN